jgi:CheY-like chemotaxis protein
MKNLSAANVMVVDDDPAVHRALQCALKRNGAASIQSHPNALRALSQIVSGERAVDLIFCDLRLPHMDGVEFFRRLAEIGYPGGLILVSSEDGRLIDMMTKLARVQKLNLLGSLVKPVDRTVDSKGCSNCGLDLRRRLRRRLPSRWAPRRSSRRSPTAN